MQPVVERPALPPALVALIPVLQQYGYAINQIIAEPEFIAPTLLNSWTNYGDPPTSGTGDHTRAGYYKSLGRVFLKGILAAGTTTQDTPMFNLPEGYRPTEQQVLFTWSWDGAAIVPCRIDIEINGNVNYNLGGDIWVSLDGLSFAAV